MNSKSVIFGLQVTELAVTIWASWYTSSILYSEDVNGIWYVAIGTTLIVGSVLLHSAYRYQCLVSSSSTGDPKRNAIRDALFSRERLRENFIDELSFGISLLAVISGTPILLLPLSKPDFFIENVGWWWWVFANFSLIPAMVLFSYFIYKRKRID